MARHPLTRRAFLRAGALAAANLLLRQTPPERPVPLDALDRDREVLGLPTENLEALMAEGLAQYFPSAQVMVCRSREVFWHRAYGGAALASRFDLASITKLFTTTAFLSLVGEQRVALSTPLAFAIPLFVMLNVDRRGRRPVGETQDPSTWQMLPPEPEYAGELVDPARVTFRHLLTHTSGLAAWRSVFLETGPMPPPEGVAGREARARREQLAVHAICSYPFAGPPDSGIRYSDLGLILLGAATAHLHGKPLDETIQARVLEPLALDATTFNPAPAGIPLTQIVPTEFDNRWRKRRLHGEVHDENAAGIGGVAGHAGLFSTAYDLARFGQAWLDAVLTGRSDPLPVPGPLAQAAVQEQAVDGQTRRGFGWALRSQGYARSGQYLDASTFGHTGYTGTSIFIDPTRELIVICLTNRVYHGRSTDLTSFLPKLHDAIVLALDRL
ncbi:MAG: beta-lactamase family protein [Anaerolineae bacterium]|nr:beta-lactamase family protein [Anaerolineae bacterium]